MDLDGITAGVLYPSMALGAFGIPSGDLLSAIFNAYNDWLADFCAAYPDQLKGIALLNVDRVDEAVAELRRCAGKGMSGALIPIKPAGLRYDSPAYDPLWASAQELGMPLSLHTATVRCSPEVANSPWIGDIVEYSVREQPIRIAIASLIFSGVFERFPRLKVGAVEFELCWAPYLMARMDNVYRERPLGLQGHRYKDDSLPSDFFRSNIFVSFQEDDVGVQMRRFIGMDNLMWGSDYPHAESTFPRSRQIVDRILSGVPEDEATKIAAGNCSRLYGIR